MLIDDEEEKKKRLEEAMQITNNINSNNYQDDFSTNNINSDDEYTQRLQEAMNITNSINPYTEETSSDIDISPDLDTSTIDSTIQNEEQTENKKKVEIFKGSKALDDGYQFGDISRSAIATVTDVANRLAEGFSSPFESVVDIGAHAVATIQSLTGHEEASKKTREWADKDVIKEEAESNPYTPVKAFYNFASGNGTYWENMQRQQLQKIKEKQDEGKELSSYEKNQLDLLGKLYSETDNKTPKNYKDESMLGETSGQVAELIGYTGGLAAGTQLLGGAGNIPVSIGNKTLKLPTLAVVGGASGGFKEADSKGENVKERERWSKAITSGIIEGTTEGLFGMFGVGGNEWTDILGAKAASKMSTGAGKILAKLGVQSTGEAAEEFLSYLGNYIVDNVWTNRLGDTDFSQKWDWREVGEQAALAFVSSAISLGGESYINTNQSIKAAEEQLGRELTPQEKTSVIKAITEDALIKYDNKELFEDGEESVGNYFVASYDENGEVGEVVETLGKAIENPNEELNIAPVIIKDQQSKTFNVIDGETGMLLDTTPYTSVQEAVDGFTEIVTNMSEAQIESVNNNVADSTLALYAEIGKMIQERQSQNITSQNQQNDTIEQNNIQGQEINSKNNKNAQNGFSNQIKTTMEQRTFENVSDKNIKSYQTENPEVSQEIQEMAYNFQEDLANSTFGERYKAGDEWTGTKRSTTKELAEIKDDTGASWGKIQKALEDISQGKGDYALAKKVELVLDKALSEGYKNIYGKNIMPNESYLTKKGKIEGKNYLQNEIETSTEIESNPEENRIFGERISKKGGNSNVRAEKINNNNSQQEISRNQKGKNTRGEKEISRSNGVSQEKLSKSVQQFQREQQKQLGKDTKISLTEQNKLTRTERTIQKEFENITGLNYGVYESNKGTEDAVYVNDNILVKHNSLQSKKKSNFLPYHELGHWFKVNRKAEWTAIHDIIDNTITKNQIEEYKNVLKDKSMFDNMSEAETRDYIIEEIESDYFGNWANDISNWADMIRNKMLSDEYVQLLIDISDENVSTHYNIFGTQEQQEQVYSKINEMMSNFIAENKSSNSSNNNDLINAIKNIKESKNVVNRNDIETIINNVEFYIKKGSVKIVDEKMEQRAGHNKNPNITKLNNIYPNITRKTLKTFLNNAFNKSMSLFRDSTVNIKDTNTNAQIKKSGLDENYNKNYDAKTDKVKANTADTLNKIIEEGIYGYTTIEENDKRRILYHNYFSVVNYDNKNELIRTIIKEYSTQKNLPNSFYYQKVESLDNLTKQIEDLVPPYPTNNSKDKVFEHKSSTNNSISQSNKNVKNSKNNAIKKSERIDTNNVTIDNQGRRLSKEQQEYFRDSKVRDENGNLIVVFHGTNNKFNKFNSSVNWFTDSKKYSEYYGREQNKIQKALNIEPKKSKYTYQAYLNIKNPKILGNIDGYLQEYNRSKEQFGFDVKHFLKESNIPYNDFKNIVDTYNTGKNEYEQAYRIYDITNSKEFRDYLISKGYDGMIANEKGNTSYAVFNSNQIKNVDNKKPTDNPDIRYSNRADMDSEGRELSREQQEFFKDSKVRDENGKLKVVYHGTDADFTVFDYRNLGKNGTSNGKGFYFTDQQEVASQYSDGSNIIKAYVNIQKPLRNTRSAISQEQYIKLAEAINDKTNGLYFTDMGDGTPVKKGSVEYNRIIDDLKHDYAFGGDDVDLITGILNSANLKLEEGYRVLRETLGYDGIIGEVPYRNSRGNWTSYNLYIAFTPEQIKNVDNKKPTNNPDIRYSNRYDTEENGEGGFYSQLEKVIEEKMPNTSNAQQIKGIIENSGIKQDEIKWIGLDDYLKQHSLEKISKQQLQDYIKANQINIKTVQKGTNKLDEYTEPVKQDIASKNIDIQYILDKYGFDYERDDLIPYKLNGLRAGTVGDFMAENLEKYIDLNDFDKYEKQEDGSFIRTYKDDDGIQWTTQFTEKDFKEDMQKLEDLYDQRTEAEIELSSLEDEYGDYADELGVPKYKEYSLEGGTNYQEILYTLPLENQNQDEIIKLSGEIAELRAKAYLSDPVLATDEEHIELNKIYAEINKRQEQLDRLEKLDNITYKSPHWQEKNVLAHARTQDFEDTSGNKVLFIDEIQSDLHQQGRNEGYETKETTKKRTELRNEREKIKENELNYENELRELRNKGYNNAKESYINKQRKAMKQSSLLEEKYNIQNNLTDKQQYELLDYVNSIVAHFSSQVRESGIFRDNIDNNKYMIEQVKEAEKNLNIKLSKDILSKQKNRDVYRRHAIEEYRIGYYDYANVRLSNIYLGNNDEFLSEEEQSRIYELDKLMKENEDKGISINLELDKLKPKISDVFPFKKNWHEFVLRRMINNAVEQGYDEVAWTTGRQQRERYNLSKAIDYIEYQRFYNHPNDVEKGKVGDVEIVAYKDGNIVFDRQIEAENLADYIGKDLSTRILTAKEGKGTISNLDEEIRENGNSGMYLFYDQEIPSYLNKYLKKWNSKVEEITLMDADGKTESKQMGFKITDEMRNSIKQNGQPLFSNRQLDEEEASTYDERIQRKNRELIKELREQKESIQGLEGYSRTEIKDIVSNYIQDKLVENDLEDISINGAEIIGSRNRGNAKTNSDLDLVVEYSGDIREDDLFNILNEEPLEIEGIKVDINPITADNTGTLEEYLERSRQYDREVLNATKKETIRKEDPNVAPGATNAQGADRFIEQEIRKIEATGNWDNSIPVTKLTDIRETIEDFLGLGVKKGHFRERAYGIYKQGRDVIRGKELKDIDNILHETGHALDLGNRLKIDKESIADELLKAVKKHGGYENETRSVQLDEGFAEVIRTYSIIPEQAKIDYPQSVAVLEEIRKADKSFDDFIRKVQQQTYNYIHQNPQNRVHSNISVGESNRTPLTKAWLEQEVMRNIWDKDYAVKKVVSEIAKIGGKTTNQIKASNNAYYLTRLATGIHDKVTSMLSDGYINEKGEKIMPGLNKVGEILGDDPQRYNDLRDYLVAKRDTDYKAKTLKTGIRDMDTKYVLEKFANDTQIKDAAQVVYDTLDGVMQYAVDNGLISEDDVKSLKESNAFYVPMQRVIEGKGNQLGRKGAVSDIIKARTGSELDIKDVLENIVSNSTNIIQQVENNNVLRALYNQGEEVGLTGSIYDVIPAPMMKVGTANLSMWENELKKQGVNTTNLDLEKTIDIFAPNNKVNIQERITSFINEDGKRVYLQFDKECVDLFNALMNLDGKTMSFFLRINARLNMPLRYGATMANIGFAIPNMISDTAQAAIFSNAGFIPVVDNALGVLDILTATNKHVRNFVKNYSPEYVNRIENMYNLYRQSGATSSTRMSQFRDSTQSNMKDIYGTKKSETLGIHEKWKPLKRLLDIMTYIPEISEQSTRFRVFEKNYDMYKSKGNSEMDARILAALESRDATQDFGRTGNLTREINQLIPFSAARVGSSYTFAEKVKANPKRTAMRIAILSAIALAIKAIGYDDKEIEELIQRKKDDNFVMKVGDKVVTIKKPQGLLRSIVNLTEYIQDLATGHIEDGKEGERLGQWIHNTLWDNLPADSIGSAFSSMPGGAILENWANKDFYYNTDIVKSYDLDLPDSQQYYEYNSQLAILLGKAFNYSPAKIDNLISGYFAGLGTQVTNIMDYASGKLGITAQKAEMGAESNAVGKRFIVNVNSNSASVDEIYNRKTELTKKKNGGTITSEEETELSNITAAVSNMSKVNKQIKEIKRDLTMSGKEKAEQIKELQRQRTDIARQALGKDLLDDTNSEKIETTSFYPTNSSLSLNKMTLELTPEMKEEYSKLASEFYKKYEKQGLYSQDKLKQIKTKAKDYAKKTLMKKYKSQLVKSK